MSQENVERLRASWVIWQSSGEPELSLLDPDVVFEDNVLPDHAGEAHRGHEGVLRAARNWLKAYERTTIELEQIVGSGDRLVSIHRFRGKGRYSGIEDGGRYAYLWTFQDGKVIHFVSFRDSADAIEAMGRPE
jgi:ketosteroid isomerase-like protein